MHKLSIMGDAGTHPEVRESARRMYRRYRNAALALVERLQIDGTERNVSIQIEDLERLAALDPEAARVRAALINIMLRLRSER
jgi:hypothetical protein